MQLRLTANPLDERPVQEWLVVDEIREEGRDLDAYWPEPNLFSDQRTGDEVETYTIIFQTADDTYNYKTSDYDLYRHC